MQLKIFQQFKYICIEEGKEIKYQKEKYHSKGYWQYVYEYL